MMKIYIRNKSKYNPGTKDSNLNHVNVEDPTGTRILDVKESYRKITAVHKLDELFLLDEHDSIRLEDGRSVAHYNINQNEIIESTSNPFFAVCMNIMHMEAELVLRENQHDQRLSKQMNDSIIHKRTILQVLFNSNKDKGVTQPRRFQTVDEFVAFVRSHPKKGMHISQYSVEKLYRFWEEFQDIDSREVDPIRSFVSRYRERFDDAGDSAPEARDLGTGMTTPEPYRKHCSRNGRNTGANAGRGRHMGNYDPDPPPPNLPGFPGQGYTLGGGSPATRHAGGPLDPIPAVPLGSPRGRKLTNPGHSSPGNKTPRSPRKASNPNKNRICENCDDESLATVYCPDCEGGMVYCAPCADLTHRGRARARHQLKDIRDAPKISKNYTPHAYMAPFALLMGLYDGYTSTPQLLSMTEDDLRIRAQAVTDTDLSDKNPGKIFGGFDSMESLISKQLVLREATGNPTFALTASGRTLAERLQHFHNATYRFCRDYQIPSVPEVGAQNCFTFGTRKLCLLVDSREKQKERLVDIARSHGLSVSIKDLPVGDYVIILLPPGADADNLDVAEIEVLPHIVERKSWDDFSETLKTPRFRRQIDNMKRCGLRDKFYLVEGDIRTMRNKPDKVQQNGYHNYLKDLFLEDDFHIIYTGSWFKTIHWLVRLAYIAKEQLSQGGVPTITYTEFGRRARGTIRDEDDTASIMQQELCHVWTAEQFVQTLFRGVQSGDLLQCIREQLKLYERRLPKNKKQLLIIQGLEFYNKSRSKVLNNCLSEFVNNMDHRKDIEIAEKHYTQSMQILVHYDVQAYVTNLLQVSLGIYVHRTETDEDSRCMEQYFFESGDGVVGNQNYRSAVLRHDRRKERELDEQLPSMDDVMHAALSVDDFAANSQSEENQLKKAIEESARLANAVHPKSSAPLTSQAASKTPNDSTAPDICNESEEDPDLTEAIRLSLQTEAAFGTTSNVTLSIQPDPSQSLFDEDEDKGSGLPPAPFTTAAAGKLLDDTAEDLKHIIGDEDIKLSPGFIAEQKRMLENIKKEKESPTKKCLAPLFDDFKAPSFTNKVDDEEFARSLQWELDNEPIDQNQNVTGDADVARQLAHQFELENKADPVSPTKDWSLKRRYPSTPGDLMSPTKIAKRTATASPYSCDTQNSRSTCASSQVDQLSEYRKLQREQYHGGTGRSRSKGPARAFSNPTHAMGSPATVHTPPSWSHTPQPAHRPRPSAALGSANSPIDVDNTGSRAFGLGSAASSEEVPLTQMANMTCGSCKGKGHNRKWKHCPNFYSDEEMRRRTEEKERREERKRTEQAEKQRQITELETKRDNFKDIMEQGLGSLEETINSLKHPRGEKPRGRRRGGKRGQQ